ncbi:YfhO family protein [Pedobacter sp. D749]|nr:YfhO family protein [Pedobacter sp. D749]
MKDWFRQNRTHFLIGTLFIAICFVYFNPSFLGKSLGQNDVTRAQSTQTEINEYKKKGETILWTNQIHAGMPTFQIWAPYPNNVTTWIVNAINYTFPKPTGTVLLLMFGTYLLFSVLKLKPWLAGLGALAFTFSSYNIILLAAGHANQVFAIAFFGPVIAGIILIFRKEYLLGTALAALFIALEIRANHLQMTYYLMLALLMFVILEAYHAFKTKYTKDFFKSIGCAAFATLLAVTVNASSLWSTYDYGKETIRGKSNLTQQNTEPNTGLPKDYAYQWSQGVKECLTFLIPNAYGGSSRGHANPESNVARTLIGLGAAKDQAANISGSLSLYWGDKPFTEGPFYFGASICFLFTLGLLIVQGRMKWWLLAVIILTMLLSFGRNWPFLSDLFFDYFPLYNKFRAVESILALGSLCFIMLALLAINEVTINFDKLILLRKSKIALAVTGSLCLLILVIPDLILSFKTNDHINFIAQIKQAYGVDNDIAQSIGNALIADRKAAAQSDAFRSLIFILIGFGLLWAYLKNKLAVTSFSVAMLFVVLIDLWSVDKRYLSDENFTAQVDVELPQLREVDKQIRLDSDPNYKVIDLTQNILSDSNTPYFHKSIGGYSAVRLKRFEELIAVNFSETINLNILGMLNTKYIITAVDKSPLLKSELNPSACGHAWFVSNVKYVKNADQEMAAIKNFSPKNEAIVHEEFKHQISLKSWLPTLSKGIIKLVSYSPDHLVYQSSSTSANIAIFSEIYYAKGWKMLIDGVEKPYFRANYILRAAQIPAGNHNIEFVFHPNSYYTGEKISLAGSFLLMILLVGVSVKGVSRTKYIKIEKKDEQN